MRTPTLTPAPAAHRHLRLPSLLTAVLAGVTACRSPGGPAPAPLPATATATAAAAPVAERPRPAMAPAAVPPADPATPDEVVRTAVSVFGDSAVVAVADSVNPNEPVWDLDVRSYETHDRVEYYVDLFANKARDRFVQRVSRGTRYDAMIRTKLRASGMPEDLTYLALIESGYDPHAYSRAAAVGMWQFMSSTARDIGLRVDWWMDERRDPARSTDGAIRFLGFLKRQFGSFYLAAAAYNGGPGRVSRGLTRFAEELEGLDGEDRFFALAEQDYLRAETKNYVPQLIAAALVAKMPTRYGLVIDTLPPYLYDSVSVAPGTSLQALAEVAGVAGSELKELNPALLRGVTPPDARVWVRVPAGQAERMRLAIDGVDPASLMGWEVHRVAGSPITPAAFAARQGITLRQLQWYNPTLRTTRKGRLVAGQALRIPRHEAVALARELPDPSIERYGPAGNGRTLSSRGIHVVRRGETLGMIARRYGVSESRLRSLNGLRSSRILAGQTLVTRAGPRTTSKSASRSTRASGASTASTRKSASAPAGKSVRKPTAAAGKNATAKKSAAGKKTVSAKKNAPAKKKGPATKKAPSKKKGPAKR